VSENLAFDKYSGKTVVTRTTDAHNQVIDGVQHDGFYYTLNVLGSWIYDALGQKAENSNNFNQLGVSVGSIVSYGDKEKANPIESLAYRENDVPVSNGDYLQTIVSASAQTLGTNMFADESVNTVVSDYDIGSEAIAQLNERYYPQGIYVYRTHRTPSHNSGKYPGKEFFNYSGGILTDFNLFDYTNPINSISNNWQLTSEVTKYSPNGEPLEERNVLGVYSAVRYGYAKRVPVIIAENAQYNEIGFVDFEMVPDGAGSGIFVSEDEAHSGKKSILYTENVDLLSVADLSVTSNLAKKGAIARFWLQSRFPDKRFVNDKANVRLRVNSKSTPVTCEKIAQTGQWSLYQALIQPSYLVANDPIRLQLIYDLDEEHHENAFVDDVCIQPLDAQSTCYVYDPLTFKLLVRFDGQHFGTYYIYNREGKLVRQMIETEKGMQTLKETTYNTPKLARIANPLNSYQQ